MRSLVSGPGRKSGFTLIELLVVIAIIAILAAILFPVFAKARERAKMSACLSNTKQIGTALNIYVDDNDEKLMYNPYYLTGYRNVAAEKQQSFIVCLEPYIKSKDVWACPSANLKTTMGAYVRGRTYWVHPDYPIDLNQYKNVGYGFNEVLLGWGGDVSQVRKAPAIITKVKSPANVGIFGDCDFTYSYAVWVNNGKFAGGVGGYDGTGELHWIWCDPKQTTWTYGWTRHMGGNNYVFLDGHASYAKPAKLNPSGGQAYEYGYYPTVRAL